MATAQPLVCKMGGDECGDSSNKRFQRRPRKQQRNMAGQVARMSSSQNNLGAKNLQLSVQQQKAQAGMPMVQSLLCTDEGLCYIMMDQPGEAGHEGQRGERPSVSSTMTKGPSSGQNSHDAAQSSSGSETEQSDASGSLNGHQVCQGGITSLMMRNVPATFTQEGLMQQLNADGFDGRYNYLYMPFNLATSKTKGYAFINMVTVDDAAKLVEAWSGICLVPNEESWGSPPMRLHFSAAVLQGFEANVRKMLRSKLCRIRNPNFRPYVAEGYPAARAGEVLNTGSGTPQHQETETTDVNSWWNQVSSDCQRFPLRL
eukprot:CAMPEP_0178425300 /NCGR_PEP_ID=MMETSP0689_2-20121128/28650_1 /TAXON_ID=160604 /ORGANISM="Amphidinium massartii, Strain CS-259" /LENGTH=314 /DNA_ID=CAMNT_0020046955 /DNA_START=13 /DNA_END=954 /DNA_ORIENTATION=+